MSRCTRLRSCAATVPRAESQCDRLAERCCKKVRFLVCRYASSAKRQNAAARNWRVAAPLGGEVVKRCFALGEARHAPPGTVVPVA